MEFFVPWNKGTVEAIRYIDGKKMCKQLYKTSGEVNKIDIDIKELNQDGEIIIKATAKALDKEGVFCFGYNERVTFSSSENLVLMVVDNGELSDHTPYIDNKRNMLNGRCTAFYKLINASKKYSVTVEAETDIL